jgi:hypothetical protein
MQILMPPQCSHFNTGINTSLLSVLLLVPSEASKCSTGINALLFSSCYLCQVHLTPKCSQSWIGGTQFIVSCATDPGLVLSILNAPPPKCSIGIKQFLCLLFLPSEAFKISACSMGIYNNW